MAGERSHSWARPAAALTLLVAAGVGAAARSAVPHHALHSPRGAESLLALVVAVVASVATAMLGRLVFQGRRRRRRRDQREIQTELPRPSPLAQFGALVAAAAALAGGLWLTVRVVDLLNNPADHSSSISPNGRVGAPSASIAHHASRSHLSGSGVEGLVALLLVAVGVISIIRYLRRGRQHVAAESPRRADDPVAKEAILGETLRRGATAMTGIDDARAAIIACYAALERGLVAARANATPNQPNPD